MILHKTINAINDFLDYITSAAKSSITDYCEIETANSKNTFVAKDGSIGSIIEIKGMSKTLSDYEFHNQIVVPLYGSIKPFFKQKGYKIQIYYSSDPTSSEDLLNEKFKYEEESIKRTGLDFSELIEEKKKAMQYFVLNEKLYWVLWTTPQALTKTEYKRENKTQKELYKNTFGYSTDTLDPLRAFKALKSKHEGFVQQTLAGLTSVGITVNLLNITECFRQMRKTVDLSTDDYWKPILPGQIITPTVRRKAPESKKYDGLYPPTGWQLMPKDATEITDKVVMIGDYLFSPCYIDMMGKIEANSFFSDLSISLSNQYIPWRCSFLIEGDGLSSYALKHSIAKILTFTNKGNNGLLTEGVDILEALKLSDRDAIIKTQVSFATWTKVKYKATNVGNNKAEIILEDIERNREKMIRAIEGWQETQVLDVTGDPLEGVLNSSLGVKKTSIATEMASPLLSTVTCSPLTVLKSPWENGGTKFVTTTGQIIPYRSYDTKNQDTFISLIFSPPGGGKSFLANALNMGLCFDVKSNELPYIRILDVGRSSFGFAEMVQSALPPERREEVVTLSVSNTRENAINPFDTQLGCRFPLESEKSFLENFLATLFANPDGKLSNGLDGLISLMIEETYKYFSDKFKPKKYMPGRDAKLDGVLKELNFPISEYTTYWQIVDFLFLKNRIEDANRAQLYAVPMFMDLGTVLKDSQNAISEYKKNKNLGDEKIEEEFSRLISEVGKKFPVLTETSKIVLNNAKIVTFDVDSIVKGGGSQKSINVFYMLARFVLGRDFFVNSDDIEPHTAPTIPKVELTKTVPAEKYRAYLKEKFNRIKASYKRLFIDEYHYTKNAPYLRAQTETDFRVGRKYNVDIVLASQLVGDFTEEMIKMATNIYIMKSATSEKELQEWATTFSFNEAERIAAGGIIGDTGGRRKFLVKYQITGGKSSREETEEGEERAGKTGMWTSFVASIIVSPEEFWAYDTSATGIVVRAYMYKKVGGKLGRKILSKLKPNPKEIQVNNISNLDQKEQLSIGERIADQLLEEAKMNGLFYEDTNKENQRPTFWK